MTINLDRNDRGGLPTMPPPDLIEHKAIREAVKRHSDARTAANVAYQETVELENQIPNAEHLDTEALADALAAGKPDPGRAHAEELAQKIRDAERHRDARRVIAERELDNLREVISEHEDAWRKTAMKRADEARKNWAAAVDVLTEANAELRRTLSIATYVNQDPSGMDGDHRRRNYNDSTAGTVPNPRNPRQRIPVDEMLASLRTLAEPAEPIKPAITNLVEMRAAS